MKERTEIQDRILAVFKQISELCEQNGIRYFAIGGTCLGAVRHHGFIPWDDDLDIAMPQEDFEKFITLAPDLLSDDLELRTPRSCRHESRFFIKVMDTKTTLTEEKYVYWKDAYEGVWVDIMILSGIPSEEKERKRFEKRIYREVRINQKLKLKCEKDAPLRSKLFKVLLTPLWLLPRDFFWKRWLKQLEKYPFDSSEYTGYTWSRNVSKLIFPREWFADFVYLDFEDTKIRCPKGYHEYITSQFGNYMDYPPEEKRNSGHRFERGIVDLQHSYKDYQSGKWSGSSKGI